MEKTTVLARLQFTIAFSEQTIHWMNQYYSNEWFAKEEGSLFLQEFGGTWRRVIETSVNEEIQLYFREIGVSGNNVPYIGRVETYRGSWILDAAIVMRGSIGHTYSILKETAREFPEIAEGLSGLKRGVQRKTEPILSREVSETLYSTAKNSTERNVQSGISASPPPPKSLISTNFTIDARPILSLTPSVLQTHKIHLSVGVSRDSFSLENLGDIALKDVQIGVFRTKTQRHQWSYQDSYMGNFPIVSPHQTVVKRVGEFMDDSGNRLDFSDGEKVYVDCWIQDSHGIFLFQFFLDEEKAS